MVGMKGLIDRISGRERILTAFSHSIADRLPVFDVVNNPEVFERILGYQNPWSDGRPTTLLAKRLGLDAVMVPVRSYTALIPPKKTWSSPSGFTDRFYVGFTVNDASWPLGMAIRECAVDETFLERIRSERIEKEDIQPILEGLKEAHSDTDDGNPIALFGGIRSAFSFLSISCGITDLSIALYDEPDLVHELVKASTDYWTEVGLRLIESKVDALYVANDMGMNGSTIISPEQLRTFFLPEFAKQCKTWKQAGGKVILHSCGNIMAILDDIASWGTDGIDALNNLQSHAGMDIKAVKQNFGDQWVLVGNIDATTTMCSDQTEDIDFALQELIEIVGYDGNAILATDHSFHKGIPMKNVLHFIHQAKKYGTPGALQ